MRAAPEDVAVVSASQRAFAPRWLDLAALTLVTSSSANVFRPGKILSNIELSNKTPGTFWPDVHSVSVAFVAFMDSNITTESSPCH